MLPSRLAARGDDAVVTRLWENEPLPFCDDFDGLIVLGGPMGVRDVHRHPWLLPERRLMAEAVAAGKPVLGICLGAQQLALALGGGVEEGGSPEIGWFPVHRSSGREAAPLFEDFPETFIPFHWHADRCLPPPGARTVFRSEGADCQAFSFGSRAAGVQFHLEMTAEGIRDLVKHCPEDLAGEGPFIQSPDVIGGTPRQRRSARRLMESLLDHLGGACQTASDTA